MSTTRWTSDAVLAAHMGPDGMREIATSAEIQSTEGLRGDIDRGTRDGSTSGKIGWDRRNGTKHLRVTGFSLVPGVRYTSLDDRSYSHAGMGSDETTSSQVVFQASIRVTG